jgi:hypothetical protein
LEQALTDAEARSALVAALELPAPLARLTVRYLALHAPEGRTIQWPKLTRLIVELTALVTTAQVTRRGVTHAAPLEIWRAALEEVLSAREAGTLVLPLDGHGYLTEICWRIAAKGAGVAEAQREAAARQRPVPAPSRAEGPADGPAPRRRATNDRTVALQAIDHLKSLAGLRRPTPDEGGTE